MTSVVVGILPLTAITKEQEQRVPTIALPPFVITLCNGRAVETTRF